MSHAFFLKLLRKLNILSLTYQVCLFINPGLRSITSEGRKYLLDIKLSNFGLIKVHEKIRAKIINIEERKLNKLNMIEEQNRFLES